MLLVLEAARMGEILDLAIGFDAEPKSLVELVLQPPVDLELQAIDVGIFAELADEECVGGQRVLANDVFRQRAKQDFVG